MSELINCEVIVDNNVIVVGDEVEINDCGVGVEELVVKIVVVLVVVFLIMLVKVVDIKVDFVVVVVVVVEVVELYK